MGLILLALAVASCGSSPRGDGGRLRGGESNDQAHRRGDLTAAHCAARARRRHAAVRRRPAAGIRAGEVASCDFGYACDLSRAVLSWKATAGVPIIAPPHMGKMILLLTSPGPSV